jgi:hypothetical protein
MYKNIRTPGLQARQIFLEASRARRRRRSPGVDGRSDRNLLSPGHQMNLAPSANGTSKRAPVAFEGGSWLSNLSICRLPFTSAYSVEPNNESCKRSSRQLRRWRQMCRYPHNARPRLKYKQVNHAQRDRSGRRNRSSRKDGAPRLLLPFASQHHDLREAVTVATGVGSELANQNAHFFLSRPWPWPVALFHFSLQPAPLRADARGREGGVRADVRYRGQAGNHLLVRPFRAWESLTQPAMNCGQRDGA